jgi:hypothetical protein
VARCQLTESPPEFLVAQRVGGGYFFSIWEHSDPSNYRFSQRKWIVKKNQALSGVLRADNVLYYSHESVR